MNTILFDTTGNIQAIVVPGQDLQAVKSNWPNIELGQVEVDESIELFGIQRRFNYRVDPVTKQLINA